MESLSGAKNTQAPNLFCFVEYFMRMKLTKRTKKKKLKTTSGHQTWTKNPDIRLILNTLGQASQTWDEQNTVSVLSFTSVHNCSEGGKVSHSQTTQS